MSKHMPGPWIIIDDPGEIYIKIFSNETVQGYPIANLMRENKFIKEKPASNAHLIAAAPEMLEALKLIYKITVKDDYDYYGLKSLIARAEGRE